eukprot:GHVL01002168.1.p1 GENE.GHVL01002168.1~~GHVL01002168.1.p1  ORF type:complete len:114 (-),score=0.37 GHVL01002168.1:340-681(-)
MAILSIECNIHPPVDHMADYSLLTTTSTNPFSRMAIPLHFDNNYLKSSYQSDADSSLLTTPCINPLSYMANSTYRFVILPRDSITLFQSHLICYIDCDQHQSFHSLPNFSYLL